jgi:UDP-3-O-acyl-N-acetylglucosamine deacetylase
MNKVRFTGRCLSGIDSVVEVRAGEEFSVYLHQDSTMPAKIRYDLYSIHVNNHSVTIGERTQLHVVEHLFSALFGLDLFHVRIDAYGDEVPFFDGSSQDFVSALTDVDCDHEQSIRFSRRIDVAEENGSISYLPLDKDELIVEMSLAHPHIGVQKIALNIDRETYRREVASARTFVFTDEHDHRLRKLPPYGMGITRSGVYSASPLRFPDEPVRHKLLDLLGDLYVMKRRLSGRIIAVNTSHQLNFKFVSELLHYRGGVHEGN